MMRRRITKLPNLPVSRKASTATGDNNQQSSTSNTLQSPTIHSTTRTPLTTPPSPQPPTTPPPPKTPPFTGTPPAASVSNVNNEASIPQLSLSPSAATVGSRSQNNHLETSRVTKSSFGVNLNDDNYGGIFESAIDATYDNEEKERLAEVIEEFGIILEEVQNQEKRMASNQFKIEESMELMKIERPPPPLSPSKVNRSRIKAIPRFSRVRQTSFTSVHGSASESEDDNNTRRQNLQSNQAINNNSGSDLRLRTESVCSTSSGNIDAAFVNQTAVESNQTATQQQQMLKSPSNGQAKAYKRSDQTRRFAEARRDFEMRLRDGKFDKRKMTMFDLIFYNPTTNQMTENKSKKGRKTGKRRNDGGEENVDEPQTATNQIEIANANDNKRVAVSAVEDDDADSVPAPQIKISADGRIVIDEQSLVIENRETRRGREALQATELIDGDAIDFNTCGYYKRSKRAREWSRIETIRFYKALNTLGTDFSAMCELFPGRSRKEIKMKFKREERTNKSLVDKAIFQPIQYDISELRQQLAAELQHMAETEFTKEAEKETGKATKRAGRKKGPANGKKRPYHKRIQVTEKSKKKGNNSTATKKVNSDVTVDMSNTPKKVLTTGISSLINSGSEPELERVTREENSVFEGFYRKRRSHTQLKLTEPKLLRRSKKSVHLPSKSPLPSPGVTLPEQDLSNVQIIANPGGDTDTSLIEPGSILVRTANNSDGKTIYKVFMVEPPTNRIFALNATNNVTGLNFNQTGDHGQKN